MRRKTRLWIAAAVVVAALAFLMVNGLRNFTEYYLTVPQLTAQRQALAASDVRVSGTVVGRTVVHDAQRDLLTFLLRGGGQTVRVVYRGVVPDTFGSPDVQAIADGHLQPNGTFLAKSLLVKCPSHYQPATPAQASAAHGKQG